MATLTVTITESLPDYNGSDNDLTITNALSISGVDDSSGYYLLNEDQSFIYFSLPVSDIDSQNNLNENPSIGCQK